MEKRNYLNFLQQILKRNLQKSVSVWKSNTKLLQASEKYLKLKKYVSKVLKTRHIPSIKIETSNSKRKNSSSGYSTNFSYTKSNFETEKIKTNRSTSMIKSKPPSIPQKKGHEHDIENKISSTQENHLDITKKKPLNNEEIAIVSSNSLASDIKILNLRSNCQNLRKN